MKNKKKVFLIFALFILFGFIAFALYPTSVNPDVQYPPSSVELTGQLTPNQRLSQLNILGKKDISGPETIAIGKDGLIYTGTLDGWIVRVYPDGTVEKFSETGGRPLGMKFHLDGYLYVCDAYKGLLRVSPEGKMEVLSIESDNILYKFTNDLDISSTNSIYFTDASSRFSLDDYLLEILESKSHGRLMRYDIDTKKVTTVLEGLHFANGVTLSSDETFLLINETTRYRILKYWLEGEKAGQLEVFWDKVPGFPDNITSNGNGKLYLAVYTLRNPLLEMIQPYPFLAKSLVKLPRFVWPKPKKYGLVIVLDEDGNILESLHDPEGKSISLITSAIESNGVLYLGQLFGKGIGTLKLP